MKKSECPKCKGTRIGAEILGQLLWHCQGCKETAWANEETLRSWRHVVKPPPLRLIKGGKP